MRTSTPSTTKAEPIQPQISLLPIPAEKSATHALVTLHNAAFANDTLLELMYGPLDEEADSFASDLVDIMRGDPTARFMRAVISGSDKGTGTDTDKHTGEETLVGWSWWNIYPDRPSYLDAARKEKERAKKPPATALNPAAYLDWKGEVVARREKWVERSLDSPEGHDGVAILQLLNIQPEYQNQGIGTQLLQHGLEEVKKLKIPAWLEASDEGYRVYTKCGFRNVQDDIVLDMTKYGREGTMKGICMLMDG